MTIDGLSLVAGVIFINLVGLSIYWFLSAGNRRYQDATQRVVLSELMKPHCPTCNYTFVGTIADHRCPDGF